MLCWRGQLAMFTLCQLVDKFKQTWMLSGKQINLLPPF